MAFGVKELRAMFTIDGVKKAEQDMKSVGATAAKAAQDANAEWLKFGGAVAGVGLAAKGAFEVIARGGQVQGAQRGFDNLSGSAIAAERNLQLLRKAAGGMATDFELMQKAALPIARGLSFDQLAGLMEQIRVQTSKTGRSFDEVFGVVLDAVMLKSTLRMDQFGFSMDQAEVNLMSVGEVAEEATRQFAALNEKMGGDSETANTSVQRFNTALRGAKDNLALLGAELAGQNGLITLMDQVATGIGVVTQRLQEGETWWELWWIAASGDRSLSPKQVRALGVSEQNASSGGTGIGSGGLGSVFGVSQHGLNRTTDSLNNYGRGRGGGGGGGVGGGGSAVRNLSMGNKLNWSRFGHADALSAFLEAIGGADKWGAISGMGKHGPYWEGRDIGGPWGSDQMDIPLWLYSQDEQRQMRASMGRQGGTQGERSGKARAMKNKAGYGSSGGETDFDIYAGYAQSAANIYGMAASGDSSGAWLETGYVAADLAMPGLGTALRSIVGLTGLADPHQRNPIQDALPMRMVNTSDITDPLGGKLDSIIGVFARLTVAGGLESLNAANARQLVGVF